MGVKDEAARQRVRSWIATTGETQTAFGERIGRNQAWMSRYLDGEFDADLDTLQVIATAQKLSLWQLLGEPDTDDDEAEVLTIYRSLRPESRTLVLNLLREWRGRFRRRREK